VTLSLVLNFLTHEMETVSTAPLTLQGAYESQRRNQAPKSVITYARVLSRVDKCPQNQQ
jgi:hypothetical protein